MSKHVWLDTRDGVLQHGDVRPSALSVLADRVKNLKCSEASCTSSDDAKLIDEAVVRGGGYEHMDSKLKEDMLTAIASAQAYLDQAKQFLQPSVSTPPWQ